MKRTLPLLGLPMCMALICLSCSDGPEHNDGNVTDPAFYTVDYSSEYGNAPRTKIVAGGTVLTWEELPELEADGMVFSGWHDEEGKPAEGISVHRNILLTAGWTAGTEAAYHVRYFFQNTEGTGYEHRAFLDERRTGVPFDYTDVEPVFFTGFESQEIQQQKILPEEKTFVDVYNDRIPVTLTLKTGGNNSFQVDGLYGQDVIVPVPVKKGYSFSGWNPPLPEKFTTDESFEAEWEPVVNDEYYKITYVYDQEEVFLEPEADIPVSYARPFEFGVYFSDLLIDGKCVYWAIISSAKGVLAQGNGSYVNYKIDPSLENITVKFYSR